MNKFLFRLATLLIVIVASWLILFHLQYIRFVPATMFFSEKLMKIGLFDYAMLCLGVRYSFAAMMPTAPQENKENNIIVRGTNPGETIRS